jgi:opacity protein-like surface antigen
MKANLFTAIFSICSFLSLYSQEDMLSLLGEDKTTDYVNASFKTNRVINLHSLENTAGGVLDFKISHRFGTLNGGFYELFGLDNSSIRLGFEYGLSDLITVGVGRSSFEKAYDGFVKYKFLRQSTGEKNMPITAALLLTSSIQTLKWADPERENYFSSRLYYTTQLILGRKFSESFTFQLSPTMVHRNLVKTNTEKNDVYALGAGGRIKLSKRVALNAEYIYLLPDQVASDIKNSLSIGFDIETGGHVFQLHCSNSTSMIEKGFIAETANSWSDGGIHFGFNISRVFTLKRKKSE